MGLFDRFKSSDAKQPEKDPAGAGGWTERFRQGLQKTARILNTDIRDLFKQQGRLVDDVFLTELFAILIKTDMGAGPAAKIRDRIHNDFRARMVQMSEILDTIKVEFRDLLAQPGAAVRDPIAQPDIPIQMANSGLTVIMVVGVNGSGKTTSIAKLGYYLIQQGHPVVLGAGDTFRAGAVKQLAVWAERMGAEFVSGAEKSDPASVAHRAVAHAIERKADICIIDTAGRLQTQTSLMQELAKIRRVITKLIPEAPHEVLLVLDATAGQNGISQAKGFSEAAGCTGIVLAKLDGTAKGGVVIPIRQQFNIPVKFIGVGERMEDLAIFRPEEFVDGLFSEQAEGDRS